jgi:hypothetical protein
MSQTQTAKIYGYGPATGYASYSENYDPSMNARARYPTASAVESDAESQFATSDNMENSQPCMRCFGMREPSFNTVIYGDTRKGYLPAGSYNFTQEGTVVDMLHGNGFPMQKGSLLARTTGPSFGITMGACVPRSSQSSKLNYAGDFNPIPSSKSRGCYL